MSPNKKGFQTKKAPPESIIGLFVPEQSMRANIIPTFTLQMGSTVSICYLYTWLGKIRGQHYSRAHDSLAEASWGFAHLSCRQVWGVG